MTGSPRLSRRAALGFGLASATLLGRARPARAAETMVKVGLDFPFTGSQAYAAVRLRNGILMALEEADAAHAVSGYRLELMALDDGTATAGGPDPAQAATNARRMVADPQVMAALGPLKAAPPRRWRRS